jgi:nucleoside-triphosphatase THEP1
MKERTKKQRYRRRHPYLQRQKGMLVVAVTIKACARAYVKNKKVQADLIGPYVQARRELRKETVAWARSVEPVVEVVKEESSKTGRERLRDRRGAWFIDSSEEGE